MFLDLRRLRVLVGVVVSGTLMVNMDATIVNVAVRSIGRDFDTSISTIQWVLTGYILAVASVIPLAGWAGERFGAKRLWLGALLLFTVMSALAGAAWSVSALIVFRILQGFAGGCLPPLGSAILGQAAGPDRMGRVLSVAQVPIVLGSVAGPMIGGLIISMGGWRWIFFVNLPIAVVAVVSAWRLLPKSRPLPGSSPDLRGLLLLSPGVAVFVYGMSNLGAGEYFGNTHVLISLVAGIALIVAYVVHARARAGHALIDLALFRDRGVATTAVTSFMAMVAIYGLTLLLPLYWQVVRAEDPFTTGLLLAPMALGAAVTMPVAGWVADKTDARTVLPVGLVLACLGATAYTQVATDTSPEFLGCAVFLIGAGTGTMNAATSALAYATLPRAVIPRAVSALYTINRLGSSVGTALFAILLQLAVRADAPGYGSLFDPISSLSHTQTAPALAQAFATAFWMVVALMIAASVVALVLSRTRWRAQYAQSPTQSAITSAEPKSIA